VTILFEDSHLLIVNKPAGLTVNRSSTTKDTETLFDWGERYASWPLVTSALEFNDRCGVVHRLDKETSGALVIAKDPDTFVALQKQFKDRTVQKEYTVLVHGQLDNLSRPGFIVDAPIGRNPRNRFRQAVVESGRPAVTEFELRRAAPWGGSTDETVTPPTRPIAVSLLSAYPKTGRMQALIANAILFAVLMLATIHLNNQPHFQAYKIEHKIQERMLAAEFETLDLPTTQALP